jgi:CRP/FNR family transcriptional regulator
MQNPQSRVLDTLRRRPLFTDLSELELRTIAEEVRRQTFAAGVTVFAEGEACRDLLVVEEGAVRLMKTAPNGPRQLIGIERRGASLAEVPIFDEGLHTATAEAVEATRILRIEAKRFRAICKPGSRLTCFGSPENTASRPAGAWSLP